MTPFWSGWIKFLVVLNLGITCFLFFWAMRVRIPTQPDGTTGHVWAHGVLRESVRKLPVWWVLFSASVILWGLTYLALYPGFGSFRGLLGWTAVAELERDTAANNAKLDAVMQRLRPLPLEQLAVDDVATSIGHRLFLDNCAACHGSEARGNQHLGVPNVVDNDSLYGSDGAAILSSIQNGRNGVMPALGTVLGREGVREVAAYVVSLSGRQAPADWVKAGKARFDGLCIACHGPDGRGNPSLGAPNLTDDIWLHGGDFADVVATISNGRTGVMPAWRQRLTDDQMRIAAAWIVANAGPAAVER